MYEIVVGSSAKYCQNVIKGMGDHNFCENRYTDQDNSSTQPITLPDYGCHTPPPVPAPVPVRKPVPVKATNQSSY